MVTVAFGRVPVDVRAVLFDKDGTLVDLDALWGPPIVAWIDAIVELAGRPDLRRQLVEGVGLADGPRLVPNGVAASGTWADARMVVDRILTAGGIRDVRRLLGAAGSFEPGTAPGVVRPLGDVVAVLGRLRAAGVAVGVVTSDDRVPTLAHLAEVDVIDLVDVIVCGDDGGVAPKPSPAAIRRAAAGMDLRPGQVAMVGDSAGDMTSGHAASVAICVGVTGGGGEPIGADTLVETVDEIAVP